MCTLDSYYWQFTIKGESLHLTDLKTPASGPVEDQTDMEGKILEKTYLYEEAIRIVDNTYNTFLTERLSSDWRQGIMTKIKAWIYA
jgi:hypothetical protein